MAARPDFGAIGWSGLNKSGGSINEEFHPRLRGKRAIKVYREMADNDATIGSVIQAIDTLVRQVPWSIKPAETEHPQAEQWAEFAESCMYDMSICWEDFVSEIFSMLPYGFSVFETLYKKRGGPSADPTRNSIYSDGKIGWRKFDIRSQDTIDKWDFDEGGGIQGLWQYRESGSPVFIPIEKLLLFRTRVHKNNPEGRSILRNAYRSWYLLKRLEEIEAVGHERNLAGMPILYVPPQVMNPNAGGEYASQRTDFEKIIQEIRVDERFGLVMPSPTDPATGESTGYDFKLLSSGAKDLGSIRKAIQDYKADLAATVHANFIRVGTGGTGSYALDKNKTEFFALTLGSLLDGVQGVLNRFALDRLMALNGAPQEAWPTFEHGEIIQASAEDTAMYISQLGTHISRNTETENELRRRGNLPLINTDREGEQNTAIIPNIETVGHMDQLLKVVQSVRAGLLAGDTARSILRIVFNLSEEQAEEIVSAELEAEPANLPDMPGSAMSPLEQAAQATPPPMNTEAEDEPAYPEEQEDDATSEA